MINAKSYPSEIGGKCLLGLLGVLFVIDWLGAVTRPPEIAVVGIVIWFIFLAVLAVYTVRALWELIVVIPKFSSLVTLAVIGLYTGIAIWNLQDPRSLSGEATQQVGGAMQQLLTPDSDHGFWATSFLGHFTRQYYVSILPTLLAGTSQAALNAGGSIYLFIGLILFSTAILRLLRGGVIADLIVAFGLLLLPQFHYFSWALLIYDESVFPLGIALIIVGLFVDLMVERSLMKIALIGFMLLLALYAYTPALAIYGLGVVALPVVALQYSERTLIRRLASGISAALILSGALALYDVSSLKLMPEQAEQGSALIRASERLTVGLNHLAFNTLSPPSATWLFKLIFVVTLLITLLGLKRWRFVPISIWCLFVVTFALVSKGYAAPPVEFSIHRALVMLPLLISMVIAILYSLIPQRGWRRWLFCSLQVGLIGWCGYTGVVFAKAYQDSRPIHHQLIFVNWLQDQVVKDNLPIVLHISPALEYQYVSVGDIFSYFRRDSTTQMLDGVCTRSSINLEGRPELALVLEGDICEQMFQENRYPLLGSTKVVDTSVRVYRFL